LACLLAGSNGKDCFMHIRKTGFGPRMHNVGTEKRREKVVVLRALQRAIIYTRELSKQVIEDHVSTAFTVYSVNEGARLTHNIMAIGSHIW
jgi:hypothetical protein